MLHLNGRGGGGAFWRKLQYQNPTERQQLLKITCIQPAWAPWRRNASADCHPMWWCWGPWVCICMRRFLACTDIRNFFFKKKYSLITTAAIKQVIVQVYECQFKSAGLLNGYFSISEALVQWKWMVTRCYIFGCMGGIQTHLDNNHNKIHVCYNKS